MIGRLLARLRRTSRSGRVLLALLVLAVAIAAFPSLFTGSDPLAIDADALLQSPSWSHPLGTDETGGDVLAKVLYALRLDAAIALGSVLLAAVVAVPCGVIAGYFGRGADAVMTSASAAILAIPMILFAVLIAASFGASLRTLVGVLALVFVPQIYLVVRAQARAVAHRDFVLASIAAGMRRRRILLHHVLPHTLRPLSVIVPQLMAVAILTEAGLSYLGLGVQPPSITWGTLMLTAKNYAIEAPWYAISTGVVVTVVASVLIYAGDVAGKAVTVVRGG